MIGPAPFLHSRLADAYNPLPQPQILSVPQRGLLGPLVAKGYRQRRQTGGQRGKGGGQPGRLVGHEPSLSPHPLPGGAERARVCSDKWRVNGAPSRGRAPSQKSPGAEATDAQRAGSSLPARPRPPGLESGRSPLRVRASVVASGAPGPEPRTRAVEGGALGLRGAGSGTRGNAVPGGAPWQPCFGLAGSPAWGLRKLTPGSRVRRPPLCAGERCGRNTSIFTFLIVRASFPGRSRGRSGREWAGVSLSCGLELRRGAGAWAPPERCAGRGFRCAREARGSVPGLARSAELRKGGPRAPRRAPSSSPTLQGAAAAPCPA